MKIRIYIKWLELNGDMITTWFYYKTNKRGAAGTTGRLWSRRVRERLFILKDKNQYEANAEAG